MIHARSVQNNCLNINAPWRWRRGQNQHKIINISITEVKGSIKQAF